MPDRDYYLSNEQASERRPRQILDVCEGSARRRRHAAGRSRGEEDRRAGNAFAKAHWTRVQNRDAEKTYNRYELEELAKLTPAIDWREFFIGAVVPLEKVPALNVTQPSYFKALSKAVDDVPLEDWRTYFRYKMLMRMRRTCRSDSCNCTSSSRIARVSGVQELKPRWKRGVDTVESAIGDLVGKVYVERHFSPEAKERMDALVGNLKRAFGEGIDDLEWMTPETKQKAHAKLAAFATKIGYPERWRDWSKLEVKRDDLIGNEQRAIARRAGSRHREARWPDRSRPNG